MMKGDGKAAISRRGAALAAASPLQHPNRAGVYRLDPALHPLSRKASSRRDGPGRGGGISDAPRGGATGQCFNADAGAFGADLRLQSDDSEASAAFGAGAGKQAAKAAGGVKRRGGGPG